MTKNEEEELITLIKDNNRLLKSVWNYLSNANDDFKEFIINVIANQIGKK